MSDRIKRSLIFVENNFSMSYFRLKTPLVDRAILSITLLISYLAASFPAWIVEYGIVFVVILVIVFGIPHGAADCLILKYSDRASFTGVRRFNFYATYIFLIVGDITCWHWFPDLALSIFIVISLYHLGQSELYFLSLPNNLIQSFMYCCWGAFVIFVPILADPEAVAAILKEVSGEAWFTELPYPEYAIVSLILLNLLLLGGLTQLRYLSQSIFWREVVNLLVLAVLFNSAPLIVSFGVYFALWHSLSSTRDQIRLIRQFDPAFNLTAFYVQTAPLTLVSIALFVLMLTQLPGSFTEPSSYHNIDQLIGLFFIGLSAITLPHAVIRDSLYRSH